MPFYTEEELQAVKNQADIVQVISQYVSLQKKGREYVGICPFHEDHDPSMRVNPEKQIFKCFVCGAGGNVFRFVQKKEEITFPEAVAKLAAQYNVPLKNGGLPAVTSSPKQKARQVLQDFYDFARYYLSAPEAKFAADYCQTRKISKEIQEQFQIGYAPDVASCQRFLKNKGFDPKDLQDSGLVNEDGFPLFHDRLLIPIFDGQNNPVGLTARTLSKDKDIPKYINTGATPLYTKGDIVFNYARAREASRKSRRVILCEGAMDVIGLAKAGIHEGVCMLGTACTSRQLQLLKDLKVPVHVFYDNDRAGQDACYAFGKMARKAGIATAVVVNTGGKDPDEIFIEQGADALLATVSHTVSYAQFLLDYLEARLDLNNYEDRKRYGQEIAEAAASLEEFERPVIFEKIKEKTGFDFAATAVLSRPLETKRPIYRQAPAPKILQGSLQAEKNVLACMLKSRDLAARFRQEIGFFQDPVCTRLSLYIYNAYQAQAVLDADGLFAAIEDDQAADLLAELLESETPEDPMFFEQSLVTMQDRALAVQIETLNAQIARETDLMKKLQLASEKKLLIQQRKSLADPVDPRSA